jgi:hypothetical protein
MINDNITGRDELKSFDFKDIAGVLFMDDEQDSVPCTSCCGGSSKSCAVLCNTTISTQNDTQDPFEILHRFGDLN